MTKLFVLAPLSISSSIVLFIGLHILTGKSAVVLHSFQEELTVVTLSSGVDRPQENISSAIKSLTLPSPPSPPRSEIPQHIPMPSPQLRAPSLSIPRDSIMASAALEMRGLQDLSFNVDAPSRHATSESNGPITANEGVVPLVYFPPLYPSRARRLSIEGEVTLEFTITKEGLVDEIEVIKSTPSRIFDSAAQRAVSKWKFAPKKEDGKKVAQRVIQTIRFDLK